MNKITISLVAIGGLALPLTSANAATLAEFDSGSLSWTNFVNISGQTQSGGVLSGTITGNDPHFQKVFTQVVEPTANQYLHYRLKAANTLGGNTQFFWDSAGGFNGANSVTTPLIADGAFHDYIIDLSLDADWNDQLLSGFRFDPSSSGTGAFELDYLRLSSRADDSYA